MVDDVADYLAITQLHRAYADVSTRRAWSELRQLVTSDVRFRFDLRTGTVFEFEGPDAFVEFAESMVDGFSFYEYVPLNFVFDPVSADAGRGRSYSFEIGQDRTSGDVTFFYGWYRDEYARVGESWRFSRRHYASLARRTGEQPLVSFPLVGGA